MLGLVLCLAPLSLLAQFETAEVLGTVTDSTGQVVAGASVTLTSQETNIESKTVTDAAGDYGFFNVKVGTYTITVEHAGFTKFTTPDVRVDVTARQRVDAKLQVGQITESVTVTGAAEVLQTDSSDHSQVINQAADRGATVERPGLCESSAAGHQRSHLSASAQFLSQRHAA